MLLILAAALAFVAGVALQRGGICAVKAVRDVVEAGRWSMFLSFVECVAWALIALIAAQLFGVMSLAEWPRYPSNLAALAGGALFGVGALVTGACAFGAAGRLAAGELSFLAWAPGFVAGAAAARAAGAEAGAAAPMAFGLAGVWLVATGVLLAGFVAWRLWTLRRASWRPEALARTAAASTWPPALAMAVIALANVGLLLIIFSWPYTMLLVDLAFARGEQIAARVLLAAAFFIGAWLGAASVRRFRLRGADLGTLASRFSGGVLMGGGAALIPGGNDSLVLLGLPLLQPYAFIAYAAMIAVIAAGFWLRRRARSRQGAAPAP